jgi:membrane-bound lytic murein transglycosylase D
MHKRRVWLVLLTILLIAFIGCSAKYRTRPLTEEEPVPDDSAKEAVTYADSLYSSAVEFFVAENYDSAGYYLNRVIGYLSSDIDWSSDETALGERRILLYKCRYFLERIPSAEEEIPPHELELAAIEPKKTPLPSIEIVDNAKVQKWIDYFCGRGRTTFHRWVKRSGQYRMTTLKILKEEGMPLELVNLALIESGFNPNAYSSAHAVGMWQFIRSTARLYGMRVDWWVDERRDPVRATRAASRYLRDLYTAFDNWELAMAAYNTGQRGVERAMKRSRSDNYWELSLPRETRDYVPKFMAACIIMANPGAYDFDLEYDPPIEFEEISVAPKTSLAVIASCAGAESKYITVINPHLIRECAPDGDGNYGVRIPRGTLEICQANLAEIPRDERVAKTYANPYMKHTVKSGESLSVIARKYQTSVTTIAQANGIKNYHRIRAGQVLTIPYGDGAALPQNPGVHVVRRGETLTSVAHRYGLRVNDIAVWNDLRSRDLIYPGQKLIVSLDATAKPPSVRSSGETLVHVVNRGENVSTIAAKYGASCDAVLSANGLSSRDRIYPGQKIRIPGSAPAATEEYTVKSGDTISGIASKFGVSTSAVLEANSMGSRDRIYPGQKIRISGGTGAASFEHTVKSGDTVYDIAARYGVSTSAVLAANCMGPRDRIYPGEKIKIPAGGTPRDEVIVHSVRRGDTITSIAKKYGASSGDVLKENGLGPRDKIYPGQKIRVRVRGRT